MSNLMLRNRGGFDELYTPMYGVVPILKYLKPNSKILCPFDTEKSSYYEAFTRNGHIVTATHQWDGKDFFDYTPEDVKDFDYIISNPPFSVKDDVLQHLYKLKKPFAMLMPINTLEGVRRSKMFKEYGIQVLVLDKRINFMEEKGKSSYFNTSYFCNSVLPEMLVFEEINKGEKNG